MSITSHQFESPNETCDLRTNPVPDSDRNEILLQPDDPAFKPAKTALGRKLREIRRNYILSGGTLVTVDEINVKVAELRGAKEQGRSCRGLGHLPTQGCSSPRFAVTHL